MAKTASIQHGFQGPRAVKPIIMTGEDVRQHYGALRRFGVGFRDDALRGMTEAHGFDAADFATAPLPGVTTASIPGNIQFLQAWLPGFIRVITAPRKSDDLMGIATVGSFEDEEIVQGIMEPLGTPVPYTDHGNVPLMSWNLNYETRTIVRFEAGLEVGVLEELRASRVKVSTSAEKRAAASMALDILRNRIGFYGFNNGTNRTYGFLNDPNLPAYVNLPNGAGGQSEWTTKTTLEIIADIRNGLTALRVQSKGVIDPKKTPITMAVPDSAVDALTTPTELGYSVAQWMKENYPNVRVESAPELEGANGGESALYFYAESVQDGASDDSRTWLQAVPARFFALGVEKRSKTYVEDFANATAGAFLKRPYAVKRYSGV